MTRVLREMWPLRLAVVWQQVSAGPVRTTQANTLFKRDLTRLQADPLLSAAPADGLAPVPDAGVLALFWAKAIGLLSQAEDELRANPFPPSWGATLASAQVQLFAALPLVEGWDPLAGYAPSDTGLSQMPSAGFLCLLLARGWVEPATVAGWLWTQHPSWAGTLWYGIHAKSFSGNSSSPQYHERLYGFRITITLRVESRQTGQVAGAAHARTG